MEAAQKSVIAVEALSRDIGIPPGLGALGIKDLNIDQLAEDAMDDKGTFPFNPRSPSKKNVVEIFKEASKK
jgi:alcohol dehydrogenase class IV